MLSLSTIGVPKAAAAAAQTIATTTATTAVAAQAVTTTAQIATATNNALTQVTYVGTTAIPLDRTSAIQTLNGVSIDGNAATATHMPYSGLTGTVPIWNQNTTGSSASCTGAAATVSTLTTAQVFSAINNQNNSDWYRTSGNTGWYNATYAVGMYAVTTGRVDSYNGSSIYSSGALYSAGDIVAYYSDARLKTVKGNIPNALAKVCSLNGVVYTNNELAQSFGYTGAEEQIGVIAQEVQAVLPQIVVPAPFDTLNDKDGNPYSKSGDNYMTVKYEKLVPLLIEAIKELNSKVAALEANA